MPLHLRQYGNDYIMLPKDTIISVILKSKEIIMDEQVFLFASQ